MYVLMTVAIQPEENVSSDSPSRAPAQDEPSDTASTIPVAAETTS